MNCPTHEQIKQARERYGVDRARAAFMLGVTEVDWNNWESGHQVMPQGHWNLWLLKTNLDEYKRRNRG